MKVPFLMPKLGMGMTEGSVDTWLCKVGDVVVEGVSIVEIESEKAVVEVESPVSGTVIELVVEPGLVVEVGTVLAYIEVDE